MSQRAATLVKSSLRGHKLLGFLEIQTHLRDLRFVFLCKQVFGRLYANKVSQDSTNYSRPEIPLLSRSVLSGLHRFASQHRVSAHSS